MKSRTDEMSIKATIEDLEELEFCMRFIVADKVNQKKVDKLHKLVKKLKKKKYDGIISEEYLEGDYIDEDL